SLGHYGRSKPPGTSLRAARGERLPGQPEGRDGGRNDPHAPREPEQPDAGDPSPDRRAGEARDSNNRKELVLRSKIRPGGVRAMEYRSFGNSNLSVSTVGFGTWPIGGTATAEGYGGVDDAEAIAAIRRALNLGITCFDSAPAYGLGRAET